MPEPSTAPSRIDTASQPSGRRLYRCPPQCEQNALMFPPPGGGHSVTSSSPRVMRKLPGAVAPEGDAGVPVRRWQRVQWHQPASVSGSVTSKATWPQVQCPVSMGGDASAAPGHPSSGSQRPRAAVDPYG